MNQEKIGNFIKNIRIKNNLTQDEFARSLHVTPQAVSKWERGLCIPDISVLKDISEKYNVDIDEIINGKRKKKNNYIIVAVIIFLVVLGISLFLIFRNKGDEYKFRDVTSMCDEYKIAGIAAYDANKSSIYISKIEYCGNEELKEKFSTISCSLYETFNDTTKKISSCEEKQNITLNDYLKTISIKVDNYTTVCRDFDTSELYLEINAEGKTHYNHKIPIKITTCK